MKKVDFMVIGAPKCGTTSLCKYLARHPEISFSNPKEPNYFNFRHDKISLEEYHDLFGNKPEKLWGEGSVQYSDWPHIFNTHKRIFDYNKNMKFIFIMRHPIDRIVSEYLYNKSRRLIKYDDFFNEVVRNAQYVRRSRYYTQLLPFLKTFKREQFCLLFFEDLRDNYEKVLEQLSQFLSINLGLFGDSAAIHENKSNPSIQVGNSIFRKILKTGITKFVPPTFKKSIKANFFKTESRPNIFPELHQFFLNELIADIEYLEKLMGLKLDYWKSNTGGYNENTINN